MYPYLSLLASVHLRSKRRKTSYSTLSSVYLKKHKISHFQKHFFYLPDISVLFFAKILKGYVVTHNIFGLIDW